MKLMPPTRAPWPKKRGLRAFHHFDALEVEHGEVGAVARRADRDIVLEHGHARAAAIRRDAAQGVARLVEALRLHLQAGGEVGEVLDVVGVELVEAGLVGDHDVDRDLDEILFLLLRA